MIYENLDILEPQEDLIRDLFFPFSFFFFSFLFFLWFLHLIRFLLGQNQIHRLDTEESLMEECPKCSMSFKLMKNTQQIENHLNECFSMEGSSLIAHRYLVHEMAISDCSETVQECPICFEEFQIGKKKKKIFPFLHLKTDQKKKKIGEKIATLNCLCRYHLHCIDDWFLRGNSCPVHSIN